MNRCWFFCASHKKDIIEVFKDVGSNPPRLINYRVRGIDVNFSVGLRAHVALRCYKI
jgi:hypothetical protein